MKIDSNEFKYALYILKFLMIKLKEWKPNFNDLFKGSESMDTSFPEKIMHALSLKSFDGKYNDWFENRELNYENFRLLVDLEATNYIESGCNDEGFLSISIDIGILGRLGYWDGITEAPDYAVSSIINTLRVFRKKRLSLPEAVLSFIRWQNVRNIKKNLSYSYWSMKDLKNALNKLKPDDSQKPEISSIIDDDSCDMFEREKELEDALSSGLGSSFQHIVRENQTKPNYFLMVGSRDQTRNQLELKRDKSCLSEENYSNSAKNIDDTIVFNAPSSSGAIPKKMTFQSVRRLSDPTCLYGENFPKDELSVRNETARSKNFECYFQTENQSLDLDKILIETDITDFKRGSDTYDEKMNIDSLVPIKQISPKKLSLSGKTKLNELYSDEKLKTSPNPKPSKKLKTSEEIETSYLTSLSN